MIFKKEHIDSFRVWLLAVLPAGIIRLIRQEILPWYRKLWKVVYVLRKPRLAKAASVDPDSVAAQMQLGDLLYKLGELPDAIRCYEKVLQIKPKVFEAHARLELLYRLNDQEDKEDSKGNRLFDHRTYNLSRPALENVLACCQRMVEVFPDSSDANFKMGNALLMARGNREEAIYYFHKAARIRQEQFRARGKVGLIIGATLHRSGSGFMKSSLIKGLGLSEEKCRIFTCPRWWYPDEVLAPPEFCWLTQSFPEEAVVTEHISATEANKTVLNLCVDRMLVNVRDPRQGLISYVHYLHYFQHTVNIEGLLEARIPRDYFLLSFKEQVDWQIDNFYFPVAIKWIEGWLAADDDPVFYPKILFTTHEELHCNQRKYFQKILDFYGIDQKRFVFPEKPSFEKNTHLRRGGTDEWKKDLTPEQIEKITALMPKRFFEQFGWSRDLSTATVY